MYVPPPFRTDETAALAFVAERGFGTLVATGDELPVAVHVPFVLDTDGSGRVRVACHVARANEIHAVIGRRPRVLMIVQGPDAYVSPDWYESAEQVPTWNYISVHLGGHARVMPPDAALAHVEALSDQFEARLRPKPPWKMSKVSAKRRDAMLSAIVPLEISVETVTAQWKLGQHKSPADQAKVLAMLEHRGDWQSLALAEIVKRPRAAA